MKKVTKKLGVVVFLLMSSGAFSQSLGLEDAAQTFWDEIKKAAPFIIAGIFLVSVLMNIGKVIGNDRDYKGFLSGVAIFFGILMLVGGIIAYILNMSF